MGVADAFNKSWYLPSGHLGTLIFKPFIISSENSEGPLTSYMYFRDERIVSFLCEPAQTHNRSPPRQQMR